MIKVSWPQFFLMFLIVAINSFTQNYNEGARSPITPGYGISDYFELIPDQVTSSLNQNRRKQGFYRGDVRVELVKNKLLLHSSSELYGHVKVSIYKINGQLLQENTLDRVERSFYMPIKFDPVPGVYVVLVYFKDVKIFLKTACFEK